MVIEPLFSLTEDIFFRYQQINIQGSGLSARGRIHNTFMFQRHPIQCESHMFVTTNLQHRRRIFADDGCARIAIDSLYEVQRFYSFFLYGFVFMPDHCHLLLRIPEGGSVSKTIGVFKRAVTFNLGQGPIWQSRFHLIIPEDSSATLRYIHQNPVKAGLVETAEDYPWSSASGRWDVVPIDCC